jgi:tetratricopeptide (TPR) repeat protein
LTETVSDHPLDAARAHLDAGEFGQAREVALAGLAERPDDPALLHLTGRASAELGLDDAVELLERATAADPTSVESWRDLGYALSSLGRLEPARQAFGRAVQLAPQDGRTLLDVGLASLAAGRTGDAVAYLKQTVQLDPANVSALRGLVSIYRRSGELGSALTSALRVEERLPEDPVATLDVAEICLELGRFDQSSAAFLRLRENDDDPTHEVYGYHGLIEVEIRRGRHRRALDLAIDATRIDRLGRTTDILAYAVGQVFGEQDRPTPTQTEVEAALSASRAEHRRLHAEALVA